MKGALTMRLATTVSAILIALSTAALAQVADPSSPQEGNVLENASGPGNATMPVPGTDSNDPSRNMLSNSASPPPTEPKQGTLR